MGKTPDGRLSHPYIKGVNAFINFARVVVDSSGNIQCPCIHCGNCYRQSPSTVRIHLLHRELVQGRDIANQLRSLLNKSARDNNNNKKAARLKILF